jgi:hypothetical protein
MTLIEFYKMLDDIDDQAEKSFVTERFGDNWREHIQKQFEDDEITFENVLKIAWKQGRKAILLERALLKYLNPTNTQP